MRKSLGQVEGFVGVDISERGLDVHLLPSGEHAGFSRDRRGIARLVAWLASKGRLLVVVEATGGLERGLRAALAQAAIAVAVVNPRQVRDFARAAGLLAKPVLGPAQPDPGDRPARRLRAGAVRRTAAAEEGAGENELLEEQVPLARQLGLGLPQRISILERMDRLDLSHGLGPFPGRAP